MTTARNNFRPQEKFVFSTVVSFRALEVAYNSYIYMLYDRCEAQRIVAFLCFMLSCYALMIIIRIFVYPHSKQNPVGLLIEIQYSQFNFIKNFLNVNLQGYFCFVEAYDFRNKRNVFKDNAKFPSVNCG